MDLRPLLEQFFELVDQGQAIEAVKTLFTEDATYVFGNEQPLQGKATILAANEGDSPVVSKHHILNTWQQENTIICQGEVTFTRPDAVTATIPFVVIGTAENNLFKHYQGYLDIAPLFAPAAETTNA